MTKLFDSKNIEQLKLYRESSLLTRIDLIPFLFLYAFCYSIYLQPQPYKDIMQTQLNKYIPNYAHYNFQVYAYSLLGLWFAIITAFFHIIVTLLEFWHKSIRCRVQYTPVQSINDATVAYIKPPIHCGEDAIVKLQKNEDDEIYFIFQQIKYTYDINTNKFIELEFSINESILYYINTYGLTTNKANELTKEYGSNEFNIPSPNFWEVFQEHATAPFFLFQIFCVGLWCLDEYWMYSLFTLFMLIIFEMMMVKRRMGNMNLVRNMRTKPFVIYVYRNKQWNKMLTNEIVPGDIISIVRNHEIDLDNDDNRKEQTIVPCDCLFLSGTCVVDEALLTGESVPQIKEPIDVSQPNDKLDIKGPHKISLINGGTKIVIANYESTTDDQSTSKKNKSNKNNNNNNNNNNNILNDNEYKYNKIPQSPDNGAICYVLTTGFHTSQGELLRTILFSTSRVTVNNPEAFVFIGILLCFALIASGYVLYWGLQDETRSVYKLALNCIMIITSVVPPELPMELSLAVNNSMIKLLKQKIFCTEAFRIPFAGGVEVCCFDKTGTLTSDSFQVVGLTKLNISNVIIKKLKDPNNYSSTNLLDDDNNSKKKNNDNTLLLNEILYTNAEKYSYDGGMIIAGCHSLVNLEGKIIGDPLEQAALSSMGYTFTKHNTIKPKSWNSSCIPTSIKKTQSNNKQSPLYPEIKIYHRFPFLSQLKRMSCIISILKSNNNEDIRLVCKGAAETIKERLKVIPSNYDNVQRYFSKQGFRVLALGWKSLNKNTIDDNLDSIYGIFNKQKLKDRTFLKKLQRKHFENDLIFGGFLIFACPHKPDSRDTIIQLKASSHAVIMITGDHVLTAAAVARDLYIATKELLNFEPNEKCIWNWNMINNDEQTNIKFDINCVDDVKKLTKNYDLCLSGKAIKYLRQLNKDGKLKDKVLQTLLLYVVVYARTSPVQKEFILSTFKKLGITTLMCGDGTNDVGALKQAHVGVALLSEQAEKQIEKQEEAHRKKIKDKQKASMAKWGVDSSILDDDEEEKKIEKKNDEPLSAQDLQKKMWDDLMKGLDGDADGADEFGEVKPVQLGDASIASPFTSKKSTIESTLHIIRQGRCTLVTTLQMYCILCINCLISAYSLSVLYLEGVKFGDTQMTVTGMMIAALFFFVTQSEPTLFLSKQQPHTSVFSKYIVFSLIGQTITHLITLTCAVQWSKPHTPTDEETRDPEGKFKPNVLNTVVFLVSTVQIVATFAANYQGYPFMQSLSDNKKLNRTIMLLCGICFLCGFGYFPMFDKWMQIASLPNDEFRNDMLILMAGDLGIVIGWERLCRYLFKKNINTLIPVNEPPKKIIQNAIRAQQKKYFDEQAKLAKLNKKQSPWSMIKKMQEKQKQELKRRENSRS